MVTIKTREELLYYNEETDMIKKWGFVEEQKKEFDELIIFYECLNFGINNKFAKDFIIRLKKLRKKLFGGD